MCYFVPHFPHFIKPPPPDVQIHFIPFCCTSEDPLWIFGLIRSYFHSLGSMFGGSEARAFCFPGIDIRYAVKRWIRIDFFPVNWRWSLTQYSFKVFTVRLESSFSILCAIFYLRFGISQNSTAAFIAASILFYPTSVVSGRHSATTGTPHEGNGGV